MYKTAVQFVLLVWSCFFVAVPAFPQATEKFQQGINAFAVGDYQTAADIWLVEGVAWWLRSSLQGFGIAQFNYARAVFYGFGVEQNLPEARYWMEQSAASGEDVARRFLDSHKDAFAGVVADRGPLDSRESSVVSARAEKTATKKPVSDPVLEGVSSSAPQAVFQPDTTTSLETVLPYHVTVTGHPAIIFSAPGDISPVLLEVKTDVFPELLLRVVAVSGEWLEVNVPGGFPVWIGKDGTRIQGRLVEVTDAKQLYVRDRVSGETILAPEELTGWINKSQVTRTSGAEIDLARQWQDLVILRKSAPALSSAPEPGSGEDGGVDNSPVDSVLQTAGVESGALPSDQSVSSETESVSRVNPSGKVESLTVDEFVTQLENRVEIALETEPDNQKARVHNDNQWLYSRHPEHVTLQLVRIKDRDKALVLYEEVKNGGQLFSTVSEGGRWYFILLGDFESEATARNTLKTLPNWAQLGVVKSFHILQRTRCEKILDLANYERVGLDQHCRI